MTSLVSWKTQMDRDKPYKGTLSAYKQFLEVTSKFNALMNPQEIFQQ